MKKINKFIIALLLIILILPTISFAELDELKNLSPETIKKLQCIYFVLQNINSELCPTCHKIRYYTSTTYTWYAKTGELKNTKYCLNKMELLCTCEDYKDE